jgi:hypothetical protein
VFETQEPLSDSILKKLQHKIEYELHQKGTVEILKGTQSGIWVCLAI